MKLALPTPQLIPPTVLGAQQAADAALDARAAHVLEHNLSWLRDNSYRPIAHHEQALVYQYTDESALYAAYAQPLVHLGLGSARIPWHPGCAVRLGPWPLYPDGATLLGADTARRLRVQGRVDGYTADTPIGEPDPRRILVALSTSDALPVDGAGVLAAADSAIYPEWEFDLKPDAPASIAGPGSLVLPPNYADGYARARLLYLWVGVRFLGGVHGGGLPSGAVAALTLTVHAHEVSP